MSGFLSLIQGIKATQVATAVAGLSAAATGYGAYASYKAVKKGAKATSAYYATQGKIAQKQQQLADIKFRKQRFDVIREARIRSAASKAVGVQQSGIGALQSTSTVSGAQGFRTQAKTNISFLDKLRQGSADIFGLGEVATGFKQDMADASSDADIAGQIFNLGATGFIRSDQIGKSIFDNVVQPAQDQILFSGGNGVDV